MDTDQLLGKRFDLHLTDGQVLDIRISAVNPQLGQATCHLFVNGRRHRHVQHVVLADVHAGIREGVLVESCRA